MEAPDFSVYFVKELFLCVWNHAYHIDFCQINWRVFFDWEITSVNIANYFTFLATNTAVDMIVL